MTNKTYATNDATGSIFQMSRCKSIDTQVWTKKIEAANKWNAALETIHRVTKSGKHITRKRIGTASRIIPTGLEALY